jgi:hypothetical protein
MPILGFPCNQLVKWALATPVQFFIGWRFHRGAVKVRLSSQSACPSTALPPKTPSCTPHSSLTTFPLASH